MATTRSKQTFPEALASLLRSRKLKVPAGLAKAPPEAYAHQPASFVDELAKLGDAELVEHAARVAGWARRRQERVKAAWDSSPLIREIRRRRLKVPPRPKRNVGAAVPIKKPLREWSDAELLKAATEWSRRGS